MSAAAEPLRATGVVSHVQWPVIIAGAVGAAGVSFTLHAFATGIGLAVASTAPTWRDSSWGLWLLAGLYLLFAALCAFGVGGYIAGRMRARLGLDAREMEFRDGLHGLMVWALAILITGLLALGAAAVGSTAIAPSGGNSGASQSVAGENVIASELDELFRGVRPISDITYRRAEAGRILLKSSSHKGVPDEDRRYLGNLVAAATGVTLDDADARVSRVIDESATELRRARIAAVLQAFFIGAALLVGAAVAWFAACEGGRDRELDRIPIWDWSFRRR